jgi:hypothetical protein
VLLYLFSNRKSTVEPKGYFMLLLFCVSVFCVFIFQQIVFWSPEFTPGFQWGSCYSIFSFICMFCRSLFVLLSFFFWPLYCLFFDWRLLITSNVSFGHCIVCSSIDGFWLPLWYLLVIVLSVLRLTAIEEQTIQWPKDTKEVNKSRQSKDRQYNDQKILKR